MRVYRGEVDADYSQIEFHPGHDGHVFGMGNVGLASGEFGEHAVLTVARHWGTVAVEVQVHDTEPSADPSWDAAVEFSAHTGESLCVTGWGSQGIVEVSGLEGLDVRVRYVVLDGQRARDQETDEQQAGPDRYLLQMWPAAPAAPRTVASTSPWSQYWTFGPPASELLVEIAGVPDPDRLPLVIDRALAAHPDVAARLRSGDHRYRLGIIRYLQALFKVAHCTGVYDHLRDDHERLCQLIDERAQLLRGPDPSP